MGKTAAKVSIGIWSLVFVLFATLFGYLWYNGGWGGLFLPLRGWYHNSSYQTVHEQTFTDPVQSLDLRWNGGDVSIRSSSSSEIKIVQKAVSYTHLDVYKRQNLLCAPCFAAIGAIKREMASAKWTAFAIG